jgi:hypothetical protein
MTNYVTSKTLYHQKADAPDAVYSTGGLRSFFVYRPTEMEAATDNQLRCVFVRAAAPSGAIPLQQGTGEHYHVVEKGEKGFHVFAVTEGWLRFKYNGVDTVVKKGDLVHQPIADANGEGIHHILYDWSYPVDASGNPTGEPAAEFIEFTSPHFGTHQVTPSGMAGPKV